MHKIIEVTFNGRVSSFTVNKIDRSKLYGSKKRIAVDVQGHECSSAALTRDGRFILPVGGTAMLYLDSQGDVVERNQLQAVDPEGGNGDSEELSPNEAMELGPAVSADEVLEYTIINVYMLEPVSIPSELVAILASGIIYCQVSSPASHNGYQSFLLKNDLGYFLLVGEKTGFESIGLDEADLSPLDNNNGGDDGLDFYMLGRQDNVPLDKTE